MNEIIAKLNKIKEEIDTVNAKLTIIEILLGLLVGFLISSKFIK